MEDANQKEKAKVDNTDDLVDDVIEIDTDDHFGRTNTGKKQRDPVKVEEPQKEAEAPAEEDGDEEDDMLYDLM